jgi:hypothetical protein
MKFKLLGYAALVLFGFAVASGTAAAQGRNRKKGGEPSGGVSDKNIEKQMAWEQKVMGEDSAKESDMKKIAAAQKLADEARKNPPPPPPPKVKDPNKEGVRAKQEASIGLPIASDEAPRAKKSPVTAKKAEPSNSANDELGALVASSLAEDKTAPDRAARGRDRGPAPQARAPRGGKAAKARSGGPASSLDRMFAASK